MSAASLIQLALGFLKLAGWITRRIDRSEWERAGHAQAVAAELAGIRESVGLAEQAFEAASQASASERRESLERPL